MKELKLRNLDLIYDKVNSSKRREMFYNYYSANLIIFTPYDSSCDTDSICNSINEQMYGYLINELNTKEGIIVDWSQVDSTTSDYTIYYGLDVDKISKMAYKDTMSVLRDSIKEVECYGMKYSEVISGKLSALRSKVN